MTIGREVLVDFYWQFIVTAARRPPMIAAPVTRHLDVGQTSEKKLKPTSMYNTSF